jgi:hypothetical protein
MCVENIMSIVDGREYAPQAIHLGIVLIDLRHEQENRGEGERKGQSRYKWIRIEVYLLERCRVGGGFEQDGREWPQLVKEGGDGGGKIRTIHRCPDERESHDVEVIW